MLQTLTKSLPRLSVKVEIIATSHSVPRTLALRKVDRFRLSHKDLKRKNKVLLIMTLVK